MNMSSTTNERELRQQLKKLEEKLSAAKKSRDDLQKLQHERLMKIQEEEENLMRQVNGTKPISHGLDEITTIANGGHGIEVSKSPNSMELKKETLKQLTKATLKVAKKQKDVAASLTNQLRLIRESEQQQKQLQQQQQQVNITNKRKRTNDSVVADKQRIVYPNPTVPSTGMDCKNKILSAIYYIATRHYLSTGKRMHRDEVWNHIKSIEDFDAVFKLDRALMMLLSQVIVMKEHERTDECSSRLWSPGQRQNYTHGNTFNVSSWIQLEKHVIQDLCASLTASDEFRSNQIRNYSQMTNFLTELMSSVSLSFTQPPTLDTLLAAIVGVPLNQPIGHVAYTAIPPLSPVFEEMEYWLAARHLDMTSEFRSVASIPNNPKKFARPFNLEVDSIMNQVLDRVEKKRRKRADPMKVLCVYELSGVCNDEKCPYQHQRDYIEMDKNVEGDKTIGDSYDKGDERSDTEPLEAIKLLHQFFQWRADMQKKFPAVYTLMTEKIDKGSKVDDNNPSLSYPQVNTTTDNDKDICGEEFMALDSPLGQSIAPRGISRYYAHHSEMNPNTTFENRIEANVEDVDAWILLALSQLELDVTFNANENLTNVDVTRAMLEALYVFMKSTPDNLDAIKLSLHTLSRALEVEANAYSEALWLLYLRLSQFLPLSHNIDEEVGMVNLALQFIPTSIRLWQHYLTLFLSSSLDVAEPEYIRLLQCLAQVCELDGAVKQNVSTLIVDVVFQLCSKYCHVGDVDKAVQFLCELQQVPGIDHDGKDMTEWVSVVKHITREDYGVLCLIALHLVVYEEIPLWIEQRQFFSSQKICSRQFAWSLEFAKGCSVDSTQAQRASRIYDQGYRNGGCHDNYSSQYDVLCSNYILMVAIMETCTPMEERAKRLTEFYSNKRTRGLCLTKHTLGRVFREVVDDPQNQVKSLEQTIFDGDSWALQRVDDELLWYIVHERPCASGFEQMLRNQSRPLLSQILSRLSSAIGDNTSSISSGTLQRISALHPPSQQLDALVQFLDEVERKLNDLLHSNGEDNELQHAKLVDVVYAQLGLYFVRSQLLGTRNAIERLDARLISSTFHDLPLTCRHLLWTIRIVLEWENIRNQVVDHNQSSLLLMSLLKRYVTELSPDAEMRRVMEKVMNRIQNPSSNNPSNKHLDLGRALLDVLRYSAPGAIVQAQMTWSALGMELVQVCLASAPKQERSTQLVQVLNGTQYALTSQYALKLVDVSQHAGDWLRVRRALREIFCQRTHVTDLRVALRVLVWLELKDMNGAWIERVLRHQWAKNQENIVVWEVLAMLEIFMGNDASNTSKFVSMSSNKVHIGSRSAFGDSTLSSRVFNGNQPSKMLDGTDTVRWSGLCLTNVPNRLGLSYHNVEVLDLSWNLLVEFPDAVMNQLTRLRTLNLSHNALTILPSSISELCELEQLDVSFNHLTAVMDRCWDTWSKLKVLKLTGNGLSSLSPRVVRLKQLKQIDIANNAFEWKDVEMIGIRLLATGCDIDIAVSNTTAKSYSVTLKSTEQVEQVMEVLEPNNGKHEHARIALEQMKSTIDASSEKNDHNEVQAISNPTQELEAQQINSTTSNKSVGDSDVQVVNNVTQVLQKTMHTNIKRVEDVVLQGENIDSDSTIDPQTQAENPILLSESEKEEGETSEDEGDEVEYVKSTSSHPPALLPNSPHIEIVVTTPSNVSTEQQEPMECVDTPTKDGRSVSSRFQLIENVSAPDSSLRERDPILWLKFVSENLPLMTKLGRCTLCAADNVRDCNQRFNNMVLCPLCIQNALQVLANRQLRDSTPEIGDDETKE